MTDRRFIQSHVHAHGCDCPAHRRESAPDAGAGWRSALLPILACAVCPTCVATYAKLLSVVGVGFGLTELLVLLGGGLGEHFRLRRRRMLQASLA